MSRISRDDAIESYRRAISLDKNNIQAKYHLAESLMENGNNNESKQLFTELLKALFAKDEDEVIDPEEGLTVGFFIKACNMGLNGIK